MLDDGAGSDDDSNPYSEEEDDWEGEVEEEEEEEEEEEGGSAGNGAEEWGQAGRRKQADAGAARPGGYSIPDLVGLEVWRHVAPPPDWRQLSRLASLDLLFQHRDTRLEPAAHWAAVPDPPGHRL